MKVSELNLKTVCNHIREIFENLDVTDINLLEAETISAIQFVMSYTGLPQNELDNYEDLTIAVLCLISDMWDNREYVTNQVNLNPTVQTILSLHCYNFVPPSESVVETFAVLPPNFRG